MSSFEKAIIGVTLTLGIVAVAPSAALGSRSVSEAHHAKSFVMPSGNIACLYDAGRIRCDIFSGLKPEPTKQCKYFWKGVMLRGDGRAAFLCIIDTIYDPNAPVLKYGSTWSRGSIVCKSRTVGLSCRNDLGHGFFLAREQSRKW